MRLAVALLSLIATAGFFHEFLPPSKALHLWADFDGYHHPLFNHAYKALAQFRFPEWDHTIYSGTPFAGNIQAGLFYPPNWLLFAMNAGRGAIHTHTMEWIEILHIWLAFFLAWLWLRGHCTRELPALLGAAVFAFAGYPVAEMQHYGVIAGYAWYPLGMMGLDACRRSGDWRKLWMLAAASALCLTAGYPGNWVAFCTGIAAYGIAIAGLRGFATASGAIAFSLLLAAVQLGPSLEASTLKLRDPSYFPLVERHAVFYLQFLLPNFAENSPLMLNAPTPSEQYCYLGSPAIAAILWLLYKRAWRAALPAILVAALAFLFLTDPGEVLSRIVREIPLLRETCRGWNFLALLSVSAAFATTVGLNLWKPAQTPDWARKAVIALLLGWAARQFFFGHHIFWLANGWWTAAEAATCAVVFAVGYSLSASRLTAAALLLAVFAELHAYGGGRRFNGKPGDIADMFGKDARFGGNEMIGVDNAVYAATLREPTYRVLIMWGAPHPTDMRHYGLSTPQGFDPFLSRQYRAAIEKFTPFETNRTFPGPDDARFWDRFGVRYLITRNETELQARYKADPRLQLMTPADSFYNIFEYRNATPSYSFEAGRVECRHWRPEYRAFRVNSPTGGAFVLKEQLFPGWKAYVDGREVPVTLALDTFQSAQIPAGEHEVEFRYRSLGLRIGALISLAALAALLRLR